MNDRIFETEVTESEIQHEIILRPKNFTEYIGQEKIVKNVEVMISSAKIRKQAIDHMLLSGPPGLGKTSLAMIIAGALGTNLHTISGPAVEKKGDLASVLTNLAAGDVLFIDEIHRMHVAVEEILYSAMEDYRLDIMLGQGPAARTMQIKVSPFTLIGATTKSGLLSNPLRDRFIAHFHFDFYNKEELAIIIKKNAIKLNVVLEDAAINKIASCSRGTPRIANRILRRVRDFAVVRGAGSVNQKEVEEALKLMEIDQLGLDRMDRKILQIIEEYYSGGPVGIEALCATLSEEKGTIEDVYEPYLLKEGFLTRTSRGRMISEKAKKHLHSI